VRDQQKSQRGEKRNVKEASSEKDREGENTPQKTEVGPKELCKREKADVIIPLECGRGGRGSSTDPWQCKRGPEKRKTENGFPFLESNGTWGAAERKRKIR